jgi:hypothetical protein
MRITELKCRQPRLLMDEIGGWYIEDNFPIARYKVQSDSGRIYIVTETSNDETLEDGIAHTWECECPDYRFRNSLCKHIKAVIEREGSC